MENSPPYRFWLWFLVFWLIWALAFKAFTLGLHSTYYPHPIEQQHLAATLLTLSLFPAFLSAFIQRPISHRINRKKYPLPIKSCLFGFFSTFLFTLVFGTPSFLKIIKGEKL